MLALWGPIRPQDSRAAAVEATRYLTEPRVQHFWDAWKFGVNWYTRQFKYPQGRTAWDIFVLYRPGQQWRSRLPEPQYWMQNHQLDIGPKYAPERLEEAILKIAR